MNALCDLFWILDIGVQSGENSVGWSFQKILGGLADFKGETEFSWPCGNQDTFFFFLN
jgi:hypothetical protein